MSRRLTRPVPNVTSTNPITQAAFYQAAADPNMEHLAEPHIVFGTHLRNRLAGTERITVRKDNCFMTPHVSSANATNKADLISQAAQPIGELRVKPKQQPSILLGKFNAEHPPKGFAISIHPNPRPANSVITSVATTGSEDNYKLILRVANNGIKTVGVTVQQI